VPRGQRDESLLSYSRLSRPVPLLFLPSSYSVALTRLIGPRSRTTTTRIFRSDSPGKAAQWLSRSIRES
jgi:hypothetical protein